MSGKIEILFFSDLRHPVKFSDPRLSPSGGKITMRRFPLMLMEDPSSHQCHWKFSVHVSANLCYGSAWAPKCYHFCTNFVQSNSAKVPVSTHTGHSKYVRFCQKCKKHIQSFSRSYLYWIPVNLGKAKDWLTVSLQSLPELKIGKQPYGPTHLQPYCLFSYVELDCIQFDYIHRAGPGGTSGGFELWPVDFLRVYPEL